jgi:hypothetical protein
MPRGPNRTTYRYHCHGTIGNAVVDCKCTSLNEFLEEWGGDKTPLGLYRRKLHRLLSGYYKPNSKVAALWKVTVDKIDEPVVYVRRDKILFAMAPPPLPPIPKGHALVQDNETLEEAIVEPDGTIVDVMWDDLP